MKIWRGTFRKTLNAAQDMRGDYIAIAETKEVALGLLLESEPRSSAKEWHLKQLESTVANVACISSYTYSQ